MPIISLDRSGMLEERRNGSISRSKAARQGRYLIAVPKCLELLLGTKHYFGACKGQVDIIVSPKKNRPRVYILSIDT